MTHLRKNTVPEISVCQENAMFPKYHFFITELERGDEAPTVPI